MTSCTRCGFRTTARHCLIPCLLATWFEFHEHRKWLDMSSIVFASKRKLCWLPCARVMWTEKQSSGDMSYRPKCADQTRNMLPYTSGSYVTCNSHVWECLHVTKTYSNHVISDRTMGEKTNEKEVTGVDLDHPGTLRFRLAFVGVFLCFFPFAWPDITWMLWFGRAEMHFSACELFPGYVNRSLKKCKCIILPMLLVHLVFPYVANKWTVGLLLTHQFPSVSETYWLQCLDDGLNAINVKIPEIKPITE